MGLINKKINFVKLVGAGNDFVLLDNRIYRFGSSRYLAGLAIKICDRKFGAGADGLLVVEESRSQDLRMRIFNSDGSEAQMCGNGARCFAYFISRLDHARGKSYLSLETKAGPVKAEVNGDSVRINITVPKDLRLAIPLKLSGRLVKVDFINTGVPHAVVFVEGLTQIDVFGLGRQIRYHRAFGPAGTNADFVEVINDDSIRIRTYERGVEAETLACGTGSVAAALLTAVKLAKKIDKMNVHTAGGEVLKVYFNQEGNKFRDVWLEGKAALVYRGEYFMPGKSEGGDKNV
jgi:diaminopimelate epimerase